MFNFDVISNIFSCKYYIPTSIAMWNELIHTAVVMINPVIHKKQKVKTKQSPEPASRKPVLLFIDKKYTPVMR